MYALTCSLSSRPSAQVWDLVSGLLYQFHSQGIEEGEEPAPEGEKALVEANEFEHAMEPGILLPPEKFSAYFDNRRDAEHAQRAIDSVLKPFSPVYDIHEVMEENYDQLWRESFQPIFIEPDWRVRATWHEPLSSSLKKKGVKEIVIEPGMAFGTGTHETTKTCLELIAKAARRTPPAKNSRALDFGCGSGILSIALKLVGYHHVLGVDIDPLAIEATIQNAERNGVGLETRLQLPSPTSNQRPMDQFDIIVANILKNTLIEYAPSFQKWLKPKGLLILSGLLGEQEETILENYLTLGFQVLEKTSQNNWLSLLLTR